MKFRNSNNDADSLKIARIKPFHVKLLVTVQKVKTVKKKY